MANGSEHPPSPCNNVCAIDFDSGYCQGCFRSLDEIARWAAMTPEQKRELLAALQNRRQAAIDG